MTMDNFSTGAMRDNKIDDNKPSYDLVPMEALERIALYYTYTTNKGHYPPRNWEKGIPFMSYFASAMRHLIAWRMGKTDEQHLEAAVWNIFGILHHEEKIKERILPAELDDRETINKHYIDKSTVSIDKNFSDGITMKGYPNHEWYQKFYWEALRLPHLWVTETQFSWLQENYNSELSISASAIEPRDYFHHIPLTIIK